MLVGVGFKRVFHILDACGGNRVQIPVFTGMTVFGAVLCIESMIGVVIRRTTYCSTLQGRLLKQALQTHLVPSFGIPQHGLGHWRIMTTRCENVGNLVVR